MPQRDLKSRVDIRLKKLKNSVRDDARRANSPRACREAFEKCRKHPAVIEACTFAGVDSNDPVVLSTMLIELASARFVKGKGGAPEIWDSLMLSFLLRRYLFQFQERPELSDEKIFAQMVKETKQFHKMKPSTLRRRLADALNPDKNLRLRDLLHNMEETSHAAAMRRGISLPDWRTLPDRWDAGINGEKN